MTTANDSCKLRGQRASERVLTHIVSESLDAVVAIVGVFKPPVAIAVIGEHSIVYKHNKGMRVVGDAAVECLNDLIDRLDGAVTN